MKVTIEYDVNWDNYSDVCDELIIEDMFDNWSGKEGVKIKSYKIDR